MSVNFIMVNAGFSTLRIGCTTERCSELLRIKKRTDSKCGVKSTGVFCSGCQRVTIVFEIDCRNPETFNISNPPAVCRCSTCNNTSIPKKYDVYGSRGCYVRFCGTCCKFSRDEHKRIQVLQPASRQKNARFASTEFRIQERCYEIAKGNNLRPVRRR